MNTLRKTVASEFDSTNVISVNQNATVLEAFQLMSLNSISGVAIVDNEMKLLGTISASDLKVIST
jgi:CBS domain-containing protein